MKNKFAIVFAGVPGSSKTTIINHLSPRFGLPVFSNDQLRYEVREDLLVDDITAPKALEEYNLRVEKERAQILDYGKSIIFDSSVDRRWPVFKEQLLQHGYSWCLISFDFSKEFMAKLYEATGRSSALAELEAYDKQHQEFLAKYQDDINLSLKDEDFKDRTELCTTALSRFLTGNN